MFIQRQKILVIADLHIGIERELREHGLHAPSQTRHMVQRLDRLYKKYNPKNIIFLGDIKHNIPTSTFQERTDVTSFLKHFSTLLSLDIIPGNHDGNIQKLLPSSVCLHPSDGIVSDDIGFLHGHRWPKEELLQCRHIIVAHSHPTVALTDRLGYTTYEPCWVKGKILQQKAQQKYLSTGDPEVILMPPFNPLCGGTAVNHDPLLGPFLSLLDINEAKVYLLDGTLLGKVKDIR